jgi:hypothetical protein
MVDNIFMAFSKLEAMAIYVANANYILLFFQKNRGKTYTIFKLALTCTSKCEFKNS